MKHFTFPRIALFLSSLIIFLSGCASVAPKAPDTTTPWKTRERALSALNHWQLSGKIAVIAPQDSGSATVDWQQTAEQYRITLLAPLGAGGMTLTGSDHHILLKTTDGKVAEASSPEALLRENGGLNIPVSNLRYWIRGLPAPGSNPQLQFDTFGRVSRIQQGGWNIDYLSYTRAYGLDLPSRMNITAAALKIKKMVYTWN